MRPRGPMFRLRDVVATAVEAADPEWLLDLPPIPLHGVTIVAGYRATTKTTFACWLTAQVTGRGETVFFCSQEDDLRSVIRPRVEAAGADLALVRFPGEHTEHLRLPEDLTALTKYVTENDVRLVVFDPLEAIIPNLGSVDRVRDVMTVLTTLSQAASCAVVLVHHFRKSGAKNVFEAIGGTGALTNAARSLYVYGERPRDPLELESNANDDRLLACAKSSVGPPPPSLVFRLDTVDMVGLSQLVPVVTLVGYTEATAEEILEAGSVGAAARVPVRQMSEAATWLLGFLANGAEHRATDVLNAALEAGHSKRTFDRARAALKQRGEIITFQRDRSWWMRLATPEGSSERRSGTSERQIAGPENHGALAS